MEEKKQAEANGTEAATAADDAEPSAGRGDGDGAASQVKREAPKVGTKRSLPMRQRKEIQEMSWGECLTDKKITGDALTFDDVLIVPTEIGRPAHRSQNVNTD